MNCFTCKKEFGIQPYIVMPLLKVNCCRGCWTIVEEMYIAIVNNHIRGNNA